MVKQEIEKQTVLTLIRHYNMHLIWVCTVYLSLFLSYSEVSISSGSALFEYREQLLVSSVDNLCNQFGPRSGTDETSGKIWIQTF